MCQMYLLLLTYTWRECTQFLHVYRQPYYVYSLNIIYTRDGGPIYILVSIIEHISNEAKAYQEAI